MSRNILCVNDLGDGFCYNSVSGKVDVSTLNVTDTNSVDLTLTAGNLSADVKIDPSACNAITSSANGLLVNKPETISMAGSGGILASGNVQTLFPVGTYPVGSATPITGSNFTVNITNPSTCLSMRYVLNISGMGVFPSKAQSGNRPLFMGFDIDYRINGGAWKGYDGNSDAAINWTDWNATHATQLYSGNYALSTVIAPGATETIEIRKLVIFPSAVLNDRAAYEVGHELIKYSYIGVTV